MFLTGLLFRGLVEGNISGAFLVHMLTIETFWRPRYPNFWGDFVRSDFDFDQRFCNK